MRVLRRDRLSDQVERLFRAIEEGQAPDPTVVAVWMPKQAMDLIRAYIERLEIQAGIIPPPTEIVPEDSDR